MKKKVLSLLVAGTFIFALAGCGGGTPATPEPAAPAPAPAPAQATPAPAAEAPAERIVVRFLCDMTAMTEADTHILKEMVEAAFPHIYLDIELVANATQVIVPRIAAGNLPDIFYPQLAAFPELAREGLLMDMTPVFNSQAFDYNGTVRDSLIAGSETSWTVDGVPFGIPLGPGFVGVVVNETMFEEHGWNIPRNWEELVEVSALINAEGIVPMAFGAAGEENRMEHGFMTSAQFAVGGWDFIRDLDNMEPGAWGSDYQVQALQKLADLVDYGIISRRGLAMDPMASQVAFLQGEYAMCISGFWFTAEMRDQIPDGMRLGFMAFPINRGGSVVQSNNAWWNSFCAFYSGDPATDEAIKDVLRFLVSYEFSSFRIAQGSTNLANRRAMEGLASDPDTPYFAQQVAAVLADPNVNNVHQAYMFWYRPQFRVPDYIAILSAVIRGDITPEEGARQSEALAERLRNDPTVTLNRL